MVLLCCNVTPPLRSFLRLAAFPPLPLWNRHRAVERQLGVSCTFSGASCHVLCCAGLHDHIEWAAVLLCSPLKLKN